MEISDQNSESSISLSGSMNFTDECFDDEKHSSSDYYEESYIKKDEIIARKEEQQKANIKYIDKNKMIYDNDNMMERINKINKFINAIDKKLSIIIEYIFVILLLFISYIFFTWI